MYANIWQLQQSSLKLIQIIFHYYLARISRNMLRVVQTHLLDIEPEHWGQCTFFRKVVEIVAEWRRLGIQFNSQGVEPKTSHSLNKHDYSIGRLGGDRMVGPLGVVVSPFRPTSQIEGQGPHHHVEAARR